MKFVPSMAHQLSKAEDRIEALTKSNCELQEEICRLRSRLAWVKTLAVQPQQALARPVASPKVTRSNTSEETTPSYARTTKASRLRGLSSCQQQIIAKPSKSPLPGHSSTSEEKAPSYARSTESSRLRSSSSSLDSTSSTSPEIDGSPIITPSPTRLTIHGKDYTYEEAKPSVMESGDLITAASRTTYEFAQIFSVLKSVAFLDVSRDFLQHIDNTGCAKKHNSAQKTKQSKMQEIAPKVKKLGDRLLQQGIATRTRLADNAWIHRLFFKVYINHDTLFEILSEGHELAKSCLWTWIGKHRPQCLGLIGYRSDVNFSGEEFYRFIKYMPKDFFSFRHSKSSQVTPRLHHLISLRNLVCHFNGSQDARYMDVHLANIQELAVLLYDEPRAALARALRDRLRAEVEQTLQEIETLTNLTTLPEGGDPWLLHHYSTVRDAAAELKRGYHLPSQRHPILDTAARELAAYQKRWPPHHLGWVYGSSIPTTEVEENAATEGRSSDEPNLLNTAVSEGTTNILEDGEIIKEGETLEEGEIVEEIVILEEGEILEDAEILEEVEILENGDTKVRIRRRIG